MQKPSENKPINPFWASFWQRVFQAYDEMQEAECQAEEDAPTGPEG